MTYLATLCVFCKHPIGNLPYRTSIDLENSLTLVWHDPECWERCRIDTEREYDGAIQRAKRRDFGQFALAAYPRVRMFLPK
jgi:hypothetical protein